MSPSYQIHICLDEFEIHVSQYVSRMYPACILITLADTCILHVSRMYPASQIRTSQDTFGIHVSHHVSWMYPPCILTPLQIHVSRMYPACIPNESRMYPLCIARSYAFRCTVQTNALKKKAGLMGNNRKAPVPALQREPQVEPANSSDDPTKRRSDFSSLGAAGQIEDRTSPGYVS